MANRTTHPVSTPKSDCHLLTAKFVGAGGTNDLVVPEADSGGEILSAVYASATGKNTVAFRHSYPELKSIVGIELVGDTAGLQARFLAIDVVAKTATILFEVAGTATVLASTDACYINLLVRNSGANS
jgi:hypothetical protein